MIKKLKELEESEFERRKLKKSKKGGKNWMKANYVQIRLRFNLDQKQYTKIKALSRKYHLELGDIAKILMIDGLKGKELKIL